MTTEILALLVAIAGLTVLVAWIRTRSNATLPFLRPYLPALYIHVNSIMAVVIRELRRRVKDTESKWDDELLEDLIELLVATVDESFERWGYMPGDDV